jgi:hypothetical protein
MFTVNCVLCVVVDSRRFPVVSSSNLSAVFSLFSLVSGNFANHDSLRGEETKSAYLTVRWASVVYFCVPGLPYNILPLRSTFSVLTLQPLDTHDPGYFSSWSSRPSFCPHSLYSSLITKVTCEDAQLEPHPHVDVGHFFC